ncbi:MAG TPA: hypothetical protein VJ919_16880, partial [Tangfeifania sp.]|nr:hypothetical protein [Tangfeifania sp.]
KEADNYLGAFSPPEGRWPPDGGQRGKEAGSTKLEVNQQPVTCNLQPAPLISPLSCQFVKFRGALPGG